LKNSVERSVYRSTDPDAPISRIVFDPFETSFQSAAAVEPDNEKKIESAQELPLFVQSPAALPTDLKAEVAALEKRLIDQAMQTSRYRQPQAASLLGLTYNQLRALLRKHALVERYGRRKMGSDTTEV
jgi:psp operon transcriptional activator